MGFTSNSKPLYTSFIIWVRNSSRNFYQVEYHGIREKIWTIWLIFCHKLILPQVNAVFITYLYSLSCLTLFLLAIGEISPLIVYCLTKLGRNTVVLRLIKASKVLMVGIFREMSTIDILRMKILRLILAKRALAAGESCQCHRFIVPNSWKHSV